MKITYACSTFPGDREYNEDYLLVKEGGKGSCFLVADGLGGHGKGEVASRLVCETAAAFFAESPSAEDIYGMFDTAQEALLQKQREEHAEDAMKTTLNVLTLDGGTVRWGHVGDTRTYYFRKHKKVSRTKDHSVPQMMVTMGEIKEKEIRYHPDRNRLLRVMGIEWNKPQYVIEQPVPAEGRQAFLMCTDGFWEFIEDKEMEKCLKKAKTAEEWLASMNEIVAAKGQGSNMDNYTALAVWIE